MDRWCPGPPMERAATHSVRFFRLTHDDAGLGADEIATGLRQVRMLNDGHDTLEPIHRDPGRDVVPAEQAQRHICSLLAICSRLCASMCVTRRCVCLASLRI